MAAPNILCDTKGMDETRWQECRMHGPKGDIPYTVGGSDVAAIFGISPWVTPLELWMIKKGRIIPPAKSNPGQLKMGHEKQGRSADHGFTQVYRPRRMGDFHGVHLSCGDGRFLDFGRNVRLLQVGRRHGGV